MLNPALKLNVTTINIMRVSNIKIPTKNSGCGTQQLCSTNYCVYRRSSTRLYKTVQKLAEKLSEKRIILGHNKVYKNKNKFCTSEECNPLPQGVQKTHPTDNSICAIIEEGRF